MSGDDDTYSTDAHRPSSERTTRRRFLRGTAAATLALGGPAAVATPAAGAYEGSVSVVDVDGGWFGSWGTDDALPVADEVLVFVHGWFGNLQVVPQAERLLDALAAGGYQPDEAVAVRWPATNPDYRAAEAETEQAGAVLADLAADFYDAGGGDLRLAGHSLGARCVYWALAKLPDDHEVETVASLGAAAHGSEICGEPWNDALSKACQVRNYYSGNDATVGRGYDDADDTALGTEGVSCEAPASNYEDVDVTDSVDGHLAYLDDSQVGDDLADAITAGDCGESDDETRNGTDGGGAEDDSEAGDGGGCLVFCWW